MLVPKYELMIGQGEEGEENLIEKSLSKITLKIVKPRTVSFLLLCLR